MANIHPISRALMPDFGHLSSEDAIWDAMVDAMGRSYGITHMLYCFTHTKHAASRVGLTPSLYLRHNLPDDYLKKFPSGIDLDDDIVIGLLLQGKSRILWTQVDELALTPEELARHQYDKQLGFAAGISFSMSFSGANGVAGICLSARHAEACKFDAMCQRHGDAMEELVRSFDRHMRPAMVLNRLRLTPRERDVLAFSAGGMTAKQIAAHLGLSPKTVANTLERARKALGAVSTMEAVAKAMVYELLG